MRYPDDVGFVWKTIAELRDLTASHLISEYNCFVTFPRLTGSPAYQLKHMNPVEIDLYDCSVAGLSAIEQFVNDNDIVAIVFMSAYPETLNLSALRKMGVVSINTENDSFDHAKRNSVWKLCIKFMVRKVLKLQLHDMHVANANSQADYLRRQYMLPESRLRVVIDAVDCDRFSPIDPPKNRRSDKLPEGRDWIICVGQARVVKRIEWMIRAAKELRIKHPFSKFCFAYVGDGPELENWKKLSISLGVESDFVFLGSSDELPELYRSACLMVHASARESFGLVVVEAMATQLPVVVTATAGPSEIVVDGKTGALVDPEDETGFLNAIEAYLLNPELRSLHGLNGRKRAVSQFSINRQAIELANVVREVIR